MNLARITKGRDLPKEVFASRALSALELSAQDYCTFLNDVFSYQKEIEYEGEVNNLVLVMQKFLDVDKEEAVHHVNHLMTTRMQQFEHVLAEDLPLLIEELKLEGAARAALDTYVNSLKDWMVGILEWHQISRRYSEWFLQKHCVTPSSLVSSLGGAVGPSGLGAPATRHVQPPAGPASAPAPSAAHLGPTGLGTAAAQLDKIWRR
jgi:germacradienol/geosmin synthase